MAKSHGKLRQVALLLLVLLSACSTVQVPPQAPTGNGATPGLATVYFYRNQDSAGAATGVDIKDNDLDIGTLQAGTFFVYHANPGQHTLTATTDTTSSQKFTLQAGAVYYIKATVVSSQHLFQPSLSTVFDLQGQSAIQNLKPVHYHE
jgi:hypothetical protein